VARSHEKVPGTAVREGSASEGPGKAAAAQSGHLSVSELVSDRPAAPSPFGDDLSFPLPVERLKYTPTTTP
jgi:hypothetical protein